MGRIKFSIQSVYYSFPIQLFVLHVKKNQLLLLYWVCLTAMVTGNLGEKFGLPYLFLDPEYLGSVGNRAMFIMGIVIGGFIMSFNISSYILNGFRFPFLASLSRPFQKYFFNNLPVPLAFIIIYLWYFIDFQLNSEFQSPALVVSEVGSFILGNSLTILITLTYFFSTDKDIFKSGMAARAAGVHIRPASPFRKGPSLQKLKEWRVDSYLVHPFKARLTRGTEHYDKEMLMMVSRKNHINAAMVELIVFVTIIVIGLFRDTLYLRIPAGASLLLLFTMIMLLTSAYRFWLRGWSGTVAITVIVAMNYFSQNDYFSLRNQAYGLSYNPPYASYDMNALKLTSSNEEYGDDVLHTISILENWKKKNEALDSSGNRIKPKMVFVCTSGGGLRSAVWTLRVLQVADSVTDGRLFNATQLITGASGGSIGAAYYRELYLRDYNAKNSREGIPRPPLYSSEYVDKIASDLLNPIALSIAVNDIFLGFQRFSDGKQTYKKDRAYEFEKELNENTGFVLDKTLGDYAKPEAEGIIPMMVFKPTIVNDGRRLFISPQPVSYFTNKSPNDNLVFYPIVEGIEFSRFFSEHDAMNVKFTSVLRMNATFPYIMPTVSLPTRPLIEIMDAGMRDNFGIQSTIRFLYTFRKWIAANTSGVVILQIRDSHKETLIGTDERSSLFKSISTPLGNFYSNFARVQDYNQDELVQYAASWFEGKLDFVVFQLPEEKKQVSLSWHLTSREKQYINSAIQLDENLLSLRRLKNFFGIKD